MGVVLLCHCICMVNGPPGPHGHRPDLASCAAQRATLSYCGEGPRTRPLAPFHVASAASRWRTERGLVEPTAVLSNQIGTAKTPPQLMQPQRSPGPGSPQPYESRARPPPRGHPPGGNMGSDTVRGQVLDSVPARITHGMVHVYTGPQSLSEKTCSAMRT